jgi:hypothetical protein
MMNADQLIRCLQNPASLASISAEELETCVTNYPWFGTAQLLLAIKQKKENIPGAATQIQKALLYVPHPLWLQRQMNRFAATISHDVAGANDHETISDDVVLSPTAEHDKTNAPVSVTDETDAAADAEALVQAVNEQEAHILTEEAETAVNAEVLIDAVNERETSLLAEELTMADEAALIIEAADAQEQQLAFFKPLSDILKQELPANAKLSFEPLHTVDYFASQGIRLREEGLPNDKLGKQLKTFTQWLKTMKKVSLEDEKMDAGAEQAVVQMAVGSNAGEEIITESMAKVLEQQGKATNAIELYHKLSLLHPEKSAYFAAQIERLKQ